MSDNTQKERVLAVLGGEALGWLRKRLRDRLARSKGLGNRAVRNNPTLEERRALEGILGIPGQTGKHLTVRIPDLQGVLANIGCPSIKDALIVIDGPIISAKDLQEQERKVWSDIVEEVATDLVTNGCARESLDILIDHRVLKRISSQDLALARRLLRAAVLIVRRLFSQRHQPRRLCRSELAAAVLGDSHALDAGFPLQTLVKHLLGLQGDSDLAFWNHVGVDCDTTASSVLILNVRFSEGDLATALNAFANAGEPCRVTLKTLERGLVPNITDVFVCENPAIVDSASRHLGSASHPLVCTEGQPSSACQRLLRNMAEGDVQIHYHGDFDWGGIRIANFVYKQCSGFRPWRYTSIDYQALGGGFALAGIPVQAEWDEELHSHMLTRGVGFHEEMTMQALVDDLRRPSL